MSEGGVNNLFLVKVLIQRPGTKGHDFEVDVIHSAVGLELFQLLSPLEGQHRQNQTFQMRTIPCQSVNYLIGEAGGSGEAHVLHLKERTMSENVCQNRHH